MKSVKKIINTLDVNKIWGLVKKINEKNNFSIVITKSVVPEREIKFEK